MVADKASNQEHRDSGLGTREGEDDPTTIFSAAALSRNLRDLPTFLPVRHESPN